jgi:hypothetical protein
MILLYLFRKIENVTLSEPKYDPCSTRKSEYILSYGQVKVQNEIVDHDDANTLLLLFNRRYSRSDKTTEPKLSNPRTLF